MSRYIAELIRQLTKPSLDYSKQKARDSYFPKKYIFIPTGRAYFRVYYFVAKNSKLVIPVSLATGILVGVLQQIQKASKDRDRKKEREELTELGLLIKFKVDEAKTMTEELESRMERHKAVSCLAQYPNIDIELTQQKAKDKAWLDREVKEIMEINELFNLVQSKVNEVDAMITEFKSRIDSM